MNAKPFIKFVGGKRQLIPQIEPWIPKDFGTYHEPFVGGGALYWHLRSQGRAGDAVLSDMNRRLVRTYWGIRDHPEEVIARLRGPKCVYDAEIFASVRQHFNQSESGPPTQYSDVDVAAFFIYLNACGFNGLYRENKSGGFNVPFGKFAHPPDLGNEERTSNIMACAGAMARATILRQDFRVAAETMRAGDFVYFDSPYAPLSASSDFTSYNAEGFGDAEQVALRDVAVELCNRGVHVLLSNSSAPRIRELYADFEVREVSARRAVNCDASKRGNVAELLIRGRP